MSRFLLVELLLASCVGQTASMALSGRQEPRHPVTKFAREPAIQMAVITSRLDTIYLSGDPRRRQTANFGFDYQIKDGLWALCPTTVENKDDCLVGSCFDSRLCSTGCGYPDRSSLSTISCTGRKASYCSVAVLTHQTAVEPVTNYACADDIEEDHYMGFTTDSLPEDFETTVLTTSSASSSSTTPGQGVFQASTEPSGPGITEPPSNTPSPDSAANSSGQSESGGTTNIGAIIGGAIGGLAVLCGFIVAVVWLLRRNNNQAPKSPSSTLHEGKPELDAYEREHERAELFGQGLSEMSARGPSAYDTASYGHNYPPMTPVELPVAHSEWKPTRV